MADRADEVSPQVWARTGGWLYLLVFVMAALSMVLQSKFTPGAPLWRVSVGAELLMFTSDIPLAVIFYVLLRPVDANLALLSALFRFAEAMIGSINAIWHVAPILAPPSLHDLAHLSLRLYEYGFAIALIPFGLHCIVLGYLIYRSTYLPKTLGVLMTLAGFAYVANSFALVAAPAVADATFIAMLVTGFPAEIGLCLWLIVMGVNQPRWNAVMAARSFA